MAISWGAASGNFRLGMDIVVSGTTATVIVYGQSVGYGHDWGSTLYFTGSWSGSKSVSFYSGFGATVTKELHRSSASFTGTRSYGANISYWNGSASVSRSVTITPAPAKPASPVIDRAVVVSDTQRRLEWTRRTTYTSVTVQRREWTSKSTWSTWSQRGKPSGNAANFTDTVALGRSYEYRVQGHSAGGSSVWSNVLSGVRTKPLAPTNVVASRVTNTSVKVTWKIAAGGSFSPRVERSVDGAAWAQVASLGDWVQSWTDTKVPVGAAVRYRVRLVVTKNTELVGAYSAVSNTVTTLVAPAAPTKLSPNGDFVQVDVPVVLGWQHNSLDTSPQEAGEVEVTVDGDTQVLGVGEDSLVEYTPETVGSISWRVRTKGAHASYGPWSAVATLSVVDPPWVAIQTPEEEVTHPVVEVSWEYGQDQDLPQSAWEIELADGDGIILESLSGSGATTHRVLTRRVFSGETFTVRVRAAASGIWGDWAEQVCTAFFAPPYPPVVHASWDETTGSHTVSTEPDLDPVVEGYPLPDAVSATIEMSVDGGHTWTVVAEGLDPSSAVETWEGLSHGETVFRATAFTEAGASATAEVSVTAGSDAVWLGVGDQHSRVARLPYNPTLSVSAGRARSTQEYEGRALPVAYSGETLNRVLSLGGLVLEGEEANTVGQQLSLLVQDEAAVALYRDPLGNRVYGSLSDVGMEYQLWGSWTWDLTLTEVAQ